MKHLSYNHLKALLLTFLMAMAAWPAFAEEYITIDGIKYGYDVNTGEAWVYYARTYNESQCRIPASITVDGKNYTVTEIKGKAFGFPPPSDSYQEITTSDVEAIFIPKTVTTIGEYAFANCSELKYISLPSSITKISNMAFAQTPSEEVHIRDLVAWCNIDFGDWNGYHYPNHYFSEQIDANPVHDKSKVYIDGRPMTDHLVIPDGVETIKSVTFYSFKITSLTIPASVNTIGRYAFDHNRKLEQIYCWNPVPPSIEKDSFESYSPTLYVPEGSKESYQSAPYWENFTNIVEFDPAGIDEVEADGEAGLPTEYYNLQGVKVATAAPGEQPTLAPGTYITRCGDKTAKILLR